LTAHSNVHYTFDGGDGRIGMHGYEKLGAALGTASSNGCVRLPNSFVKRLASTVAPGTPVLVQD
jgi:lipoprotein-anchoring transpeptidase ErfK/SrfK